MRTFANSTMLGAALTKRSLRWKQPRKRWFEAEVYRIAGEIALMVPEPEAAKAEAYFERALSVARQQQAKSWELRAAMSSAVWEWETQAPNFLPLLTL